MPGGGADAETGTIATTQTTVESDVQMMPAGDDGLYTLQATPRGTLTMTALPANAVVFSGAQEAAVSAATTQVAADAGSGAVVEPSVTAIAGAPVPVYDEMSKATAVTTVETVQNIPMSSACYLPTLAFSYWGHD
jgi:hypothetical protein